MRGNLSPIILVCVCVAIFHSSVTETTENNNKNVENALISQTIQLHTNTHNNSMNCVTFQGISVQQDQRATRQWLWIAS